MLHLGFVAACFLVSGACGLIYENVWVKQISYVFGSTVLASTLLLAAFMTGLALGSATLGVRAAAHPRPLKLYGFLGRERFDAARERLAQMDAAPGAPVGDPELVWRVRSQVRAWESAGAPRVTP